jgi:hypothetical protein
MLVFFLFNLTGVAISKAIRAYFPEADKRPTLLSMIPTLLFYWFRCYQERRMSMNRMKLGWVMIHDILPEMLLHCTEIYSIRIAQPHNILHVAYAAFASVLAVTIITAFFAILVILCYWYPLTPSKHEQISWTKVKSGPHF